MSVPTVRSGVFAKVLAACFACLLVLPVPAWAGRSCDAAKPLTPESVTRALALAEHTLLSLDQSGADVVLLARAGQDLSQYGLHYSHLGFAYRQRDGQGASVWRVLHKLNQCGTAESAVYRQGLGEFFLDDLWRYEAALVVPTPLVQQQLLAVLQDPMRSVQLHHKPYSMVSYVWGLQYQQSNQWATETLAMAVGASNPNSVVTRAQAQSWLYTHDYQPSVLNIGPMTRLGARIAKANVAFDDHPNAKRFADHIETVTVDSVFVWMPRAGLSTQPVVTVR
jgi:hypothetical protein